MTDAMLEEQNVEHEGTQKLVTTSRLGSTNEGAVLPEPGSVRKGLVLLALGPCSEQC